MKTSLRTALWYLLLPWLFATCQSGPGTRTVKLSIQSTPQVPLPVKLDTVDMISMDHLAVAETSLDSAGSTLLEFEVPRAMFARLQLGDEYQTLYLTPGDELTIQYDTTGHQVRFKGTSADANHYLDRVTQFWRQAYPVPSKGDASFFLARQDSLRKALLNLHHHYLDSTQLPAPVASLFQKRNELGLLMYRQLYCWNNYYVQGNMEVPEAIGNVWSEIPFDSTLLQMAMPSYAAVLDYYLVMYKYPSVYPDDISDADFDSIQNNYPFVAYEKIKEGKLSPTFQEFFKAKVLDYSLHSQGITPAIDSFYVHFKKDHPTSRFQPSVETKYQKWAVLQPGQPAPDIRGATPDGAEFSLRELRGKVVYVDVWATWCGPCREEFPHAKKVKKQFEGNDQVTFLYVSVDQNEDDWKKYLRKNPDLKGVHIIQNPDAEGTGTPSIHKDYMIWGIPRYFLIDQEGKIVSVMAVRPSSGEVEKEIRKVLAREQPVAAL